MPLVFPFTRKVMAQAGAAEGWWGHTGALLPPHKPKMVWKWWKNSSLTKDSLSSPSRPSWPIKTLKLHSHWPVGSYPIQVNLCSSSCPKGLFQGVPVYYTELGTWTVLSTSDSFETKRSSSPQVQLSAQRSSGGSPSLNWSAENGQHGAGSSGLCHWAPTPHAGHDQRFDTVVVTNPVTMR